jgi:hypothetical protein
MGAAEVSQQTIPAQNVMNLTTGLRGRRLDDYDLPLLFLRVCFFSCLSDAVPVLFISVLDLETLLMCWTAWSR